jgi:hypothetical protein
MAAMSRHSFNIEPYGNMGFEMEVRVTGHNFEN